MEPLLAVYAGYSLKGEVVPAGPKLAPFVQDALDEIEFVTGDTTTKWGAIRAGWGHPKPFHLNYVEIGNEDYFDKSQSYDDRFTQFYDAIKAKYPKIKLIASSAVGSRTPDLRDDHFYRSHRHMERDAGHYDDQDRSGPRVFVGEWATKEGKPTPNLRASLSDAVWLMGMERNSDLVVMSSYAPLLVNVNVGAYQWSTNLIGYDALSSFASPSYYVQQLFSGSRGQKVLPLRIDLSDAASTRPSDAMPTGTFGVGSLTTSVEYKDISVTAGDKTLFQWDPSTGAADWKMNKGAWSVADGVLRQSLEHGEFRAMTGDPTWGDYAISLKARKLGGENGMVVLFHYRDGEDFLRWSIGGLHNTAAVIERVVDGVSEEISDSTPLTLDTGTWHDLKIELRGRQIRCYFDGQLTNEATDKPVAPTPTLFALASRSQSEMTLQVVNTADHPRQMEIELMGSEHLWPWAATEILSGKPDDVNSLAAPMKVSPQRKDLLEVSPVFKDEFPAYSVTVIHLKLDPG